MRTAYSWSKDCQASCEHMDRGSCRECVEKALTAFSNEALEAAAKVAEGFTEELFYPKKDIGKMDRDLNVRKRQREQIAAAIRALKEGP